MKLPPAERWRRGGMVRPEVDCRSGRGGKRRLVGRSRNSEPDPHPGGAVPRYGAEDKKGAALRRHESDVGTLPGREALLQSPGCSVLERGWDGAAWNGRRFGDDFCRPGEVRVLVPELQP